MIITDNKIRIDIYFTYNLKLEKEMSNDVRNVTNTCELHKTQRFVNIVNQKSLM